MPREREDPPRPRSRSLAARITALVVSVTVFVGIVAAVLTLQLLRSTIQNQTRSELRDQLQIVASAGASEEAIRAATAWAEHTDAMWATVSPDGSLRGTATGVLSLELVASLRTEGQVSDLQIRPSEPVLLEGVMIGDSGFVLARTDRALPDASRELILRVLTVLLLGIIAAVAGGAVLARRIARPLVDTAAMAALMAQGERGVMVPDSEIPEVHEVAQALRTLDEALRTSEARQHEFLLSISHEIRTPLTAIRGYGEAIADQVLPPEQAGTVIQYEAARLGRFVDDLLELARLEADDFTVNESPVDLADIAADAYRAWQGHARQLDVVLKLDLRGPSAVVETDAQRARQLVDGLVENALRVSPPRATVRIEVSAQPPSISVSDDGPGLTQDDLAHAFDRGVLRTRYASARPVGTGLGLSIAARMAGRLGATLAASTPRQGGTAFTVSWAASRDGA